MVSDVSLNGLSPADRLPFSGAEHFSRFELLPVFVLCSLVLHVAVGALLVSQWVLKPLKTVEPPAVFVEIITGIPPRVLALPSLDETISEVLREPPIVPPPEVVSIGPDEADMVVATQMMSGSVLADPRNRGVRDGLLRMTDETRADQLCGIEAMEQLKGWNSDFSPEWVSAYATADVEVLENMIVAEGAAFRSAGRWYHLKFKCTLDSEDGSVVSFAFRVGVAIPAEELDALELSLID